MYLVPFYNWDITDEVNADVIPPDSSFDYMLNNLLLFKEEKCYATNGGYFMDQGEDSIIIHDH